jgi:hypothetical protein
MLVNPRQFSCDSIGYSLSSFSFNIGPSFFWGVVCLKCSTYSISEPKYRKNFILENARQLREMQGYRRNKEESDTVTGRSAANRYENMPARTPYCYVSSGIAELFNISWSLGRKVCLNFSVYHVMGL